MADGSLAETLSTSEPEGRATRARSTFRRGGMTRSLPAGSLATVVFSGAVWEETGTSFRRRVRGGGRWRPYRLASGPPPLANIDALAGDFLLSIVRKERSLRAFRHFFALVAFAIRARLGRKFTGTAARPCDPHSKGRNLVGTRFVAGSTLEAKAPPHDCAWGGAVAPTSHSRTPAKTTRGEVVPNA